MVLQSTRWLALGYFTYFFSYGIFLPFWSVWLKGIGLTPETIGLLLGAGLVARFLGSLLIAPRVSDPSRLISALRVLALLTLLFAVAFWAGAHVAWLMLVMIGFNPVSYTHLDVYKRQPYICAAWRWQPVPDQ